MAYRLGYLDGYADTEGYMGGYADTGIGYDNGAWFRHADGRVRFAFGPSRGKFVGMSDWEKISGLIRFDAAAQETIEDECWPTLDRMTADGMTAAQCKEAVALIIDSSLRVV